MQCITAVSVLAQTDDGTCNSQTCGEITDGSYIQKCIHTLQESYCKVYET